LPAAAASVGPEGVGQGSDSDVRLQAAPDLVASKHIDDSRNRGIAGQLMWLVIALTIDPTTMRTFGDEEDATCPSR
jgi:hypothetical protein